MQGFSLLLVALLNASPAATPAEADPLEAALAEVAEFVREPVLWGGEEVGFDHRVEGVRRGVVRITGEAGSMRVYSRFLQVLEGDPRFTEVAMGTSERRPWGWTFELTTRFEPGEDRWPAMVTTRALLEAAAGTGARVESVELPRRWQQDPSAVTALVAFGEGEDRELALRRALLRHEPAVVLALSPRDDSASSGVERKLFVVRQPGQSR